MKTGFNIHESNLEGLKIRKNPLNGFTVVELDFIADPMKRDPEWIARERARVSPKQWAVEMMRSWETFAGRPVYDKVFFRHLHVLKERREPNPNYPIFRGWDFGGNQSIAICQIIGTRVYVIDELPNYGLNTETVCPKVQAYCSSNYDTAIHYIDIIDPSAMWDSTRGRAQGAPAQVMRELGLSPIPAPTNDPKKRIGAVINLMRRLGDDGHPDLVINPDCSMIIKGFEGGYHLPEKVSQRKKAEDPVKNLFSHIHDALQYVALRVGQHAEDTSESVAYEAQMTQYKWSGGK